MTAQYQIYRAPGWHGEPDDPLIAETDDEREAALRAGCRIDIGMPGASNKYDAYAIDSETGEEVERIESFWCDVCEELVAWGDYGPQGGNGGRILECPQAAEKHTVTWMCDDCAAEYESDE
jgi:hypothetical protein